MNSNLREHMGVEIHREERPIEVVEVRVLPQKTLQRKDAIAAPEAQNK